MKKYSKIITAVALFLSMGIVSSCTKEDGVFKEDGSNNIIEIADLPSRASATTSSIVTKAYVASASVDVPVTFNVTGVNGAAQDMTITWDFMTDAEVKAVNSSYVVINSATAPALLVAAPTKTVTIAKGQKTATFVLKVNVAAFDFTKKYALGIKITSASSGTISGNYGSGIVVVSPKNPYDGTYNYKTSATTSLRASVNETGKLTTVDLYTVTLPLVNYYTAASNVLYYTVDPATNKVTVSGGGIGAITTDPSSNWNPTTKVLYVKWNTSNRAFEETWTYTGPR